jgi:hypothetical protein
MQQATKRFALQKPKPKVPDRSISEPTKGKIFPHFFKRCGAGNHGSAELTHPLVG